MQHLIRKYPVVFPDSDTKFNQQSRVLDTIGELDCSGLREAMPHEFHDLIRDLLSKDPSERLGSEDFIEEIA
jgi:serine/threonine protein kinase